MLPDDISSQMPRDTKQCALLSRPFPRILANMSEASFLKQNGPHNGFVLHLQSNTAVSLQAASAVDKNM